MLKIVVRSDRASGGLRRSYVKTVGVQIAPVEFSLGAIFTLTDFTKFLLGLILNLNIIKLNWLLLISPCSIGCSIKSKNCFLKY